MGQPGTAASALFELAHICYCSSYMFGNDRKKRQRNLQIFTTVLAVLVIVSMVLSYFSLLV